MTIPLYAFLFAYLAWAAIFIIFLLLNIYHLAQSASLTFASFVMTLFILLLGTGVLFLTWQLLSAVDWQTPVFSIYAPF